MPPEMLAVTTFSKTSYDKFAKKMLESVVKYWPTRIIAYVESPIDFLGESRAVDTQEDLDAVREIFKRREKVEVRNFFDIKGVMNFYQNIKNTPICHGMVGNGKYNYNYDIWKFSRKMFAQWDVLKDYKGKVFWIDSDCLVIKPVTEDWLVKLFDGKGLSYLGRKGLYTETGFVGFDTENEKFQEFLKYYMGFVRHGWFVNYQRWHDCEAFDFAREKSCITGNDLTPFFKIPESGKITLELLDVFRKSVLSEYLYHAKGNLKHSFSKNAA